MTLEMPAEFAGAHTAGSGYVKSTPRRWTEQELAWCVNAAEAGYSHAEIAEATGRTEVSVFVKLKRLTKKNDTYNVKQRELKYRANELFLSSVQPKSVLDVYAGNSWWAQHCGNTVTNDLDTEFDTDFHLSALDLMCQMQVDRKRFDVIDLDPFGSAYECFDLAFRMARKGVVISFGEWGHKRWKRTDFVGPRYGIHSLEDFSHEPFIIEAQRIARLHKKTADVFDVLQYSNFLRIYFTLTPFKETSQWEMTDGG